MKLNWVPVTAHVLGWVYLPARRVHRALSLKLRRNANLWGDRAIEWSFVSAYMPSGPGEALDFGAGDTHVSLIAARRGFRVTALDLEPHFPLWEHEDLRCVQGDVLQIELPSHHFALVINCSSIEHVGLVGRYSVVEERTDGDLDAMTRIRGAMMPGGVMLLTVPVGRDAVFHPLCRVYGFQRLPRLLEGFEVERAEFWVKSNENRWRLCDRETALRFEADVSTEDSGLNVYALGCFVLRLPERGVKN